jgi:pimeloyl-ACP methyl ester carboxylesterase
MISGIGSVLPWFWLAQRAQAVRFILTRIIGDAFVVSASDAERAAILGSIDRDLKWLSERCTNVALVGHSQGAMLAYLACRERPSNVRMLITLGSGIRKLRALMGTFRQALDPVQKARRSLVASSNLAGVCLWLIIALGLTSQISWFAAICSAALVSIIAATLGVLGFATYATDALYIPPEDRVWDRWMQMRDVDLPAVDPSVRELYEAIGNYPGALVWFDCVATHDIVAGRGWPSIRTSFRGEPNIESPAGKWPYPLSVTNSRSILLDHTGYLRNREECIANIVGKCALMADVEDADWLAPDSRGVGEGEMFPRTISGARATIIKRDSRNEFALAVTLAGFLIARLPHELRKIGELLSGWSLSQLGLNWVDVGIVVVLISALVAARSAGNYALRRLAVSALERRNWCAKRDAEGKFHFVATGFDGSISRYEWVGFAVSTLVPAIILLALQGLGPTAALLWTVLAAAVAHGISAFLRLHENKSDIERCYRAARTTSSAA